MLLYDKTIENILKINEEENNKKNKKLKDELLNFPCSWCGKQINQRYKTGNIFCEYCGGLAAFIPDKEKK